MTRKHKDVRLDICLNWSKWLKRRFRNIIFSDECRFEIDGSDGSRKIRRKQNTRYDESNVVGKRKYGGGGIMI